MSTTASSDLRGPPGPLPVPMASATSSGSNADKDDSDESRTETEDEKSSSQAPSSVTTATSSAIPTTPSALTHPPATDTKAAPLVITADDASQVMARPVPPTVPDANNNSADKPSSLRVLSQGASSLERIYQSKRPGRVEIEKAYLDLLLADQRRLADLLKGNKSETVEKRPKEKHRDTGRDTKYRHKATAKPVGEGWRWGSEASMISEAKKPSPHLVKTPKKEVGKKYRRCYVQGEVRDNDTFSEKSRYCGRDPLKYPFRRYTEMLRYSEYGHRVAVFEREDRPTSTHFRGLKVEIPSAPKSQGQHWIQPVPSYCIIDGNTDTCPFAIANFAPQEMAVHLEVTGPNIEITPTITRMNPFEVREVLLKYRCKKPMRSNYPYEHLTLFYNQSADWDLMQMEFGSRLDWHKHWAGKYEMVVIVQNFNRTDYKLKRELMPLNEMRSGIHRANNYMETWKKRNEKYARDVKELMRPRKREEVARRQTTTAKENRRRHDEDDEDEGGREKEPARERGARRNRERGHEGERTNEKRHRDRTRDYERDREQPRDQERERDGERHKERGRERDRHQERRMRHEETGSQLRVKATDAPVAVNTVNSKNTDGGA